MGLTGVLCSENALETRVCEPTMIEEKLRT